jgi:C4-dicarboxylate transporter DctM subunit
VILTLIVVLLALIGTPLFTLFGGLTMVLFLDMPEGSFASVAIDVFSAKFAENPTLMTIPLFTFAGYLMAEAKTPQRLVQVSRAWLGWMPGGLALVAMGASAFFTTFTGGSGITIVAVGALLYPSLMSEKYPQKFSMGLVTTGGSLGLLFPPSVPLILYGIVAGLVIDKVLVAGILPGIVVMTVLAIYGGIVGTKAGVPRTKFELKPALQTLWHFKWEAAIPVVLIGGFVTGLMRVHEACAFSAVYVLFIEVVIYKDISIRKQLPTIIVDSMNMVGAILLIMATAIGFTSWMIQAQVPMHLLEWMEGLITSQFMFLLVLNVFLFMVGMLMDVFTAIVVVVPLILPMAAHYGVDPYHLAIIFLLNLEIGYLTPPVGINLFISAIRFGLPVTYLYRTVLPFIGMLIIALMFVTYVPIITTWLPNMLGIPDDEVSITGGFIGDDEPLPEDDLMGGDSLFGDDDAGSEDLLDDPAGDAPEGATGEPDPSEPVKAEDEANDPPGEEPPTEADDPADETP